VAFLISIGALLSLLAFIALDRRRIANAQLPVHDEVKSRTGSNLRANGFSAVSLMAAVMALSEYLQLRVPPFTGRWSFVYELAYAIGLFGLVLYWALLAAAFAVATVVSCVQDLIHESVALHLN
jgi:hypothetical protein